MEKRRRGINVFGPLVLIAAGVILLLNTLGVLEWNLWWTLLRLWPILLIAAGLDLLFGRRSIWGSLVAAVLILGILGAALWITVSDRVELGGFDTEQIRQPLAEATEAQVTISPGVGVLRIGALPEAADLVQGEVRLASGEEVAQDYSQSGGRATFELRTTRTSWGPFVWGWNDDRVWDLGLSPGATLEIQTEMGAGEAVLDLSGLTLDSVRADIGLGRLEITLPTEGRFDGSLDGAIGQTVIVVPAGMAVRIVASTALAAREVPPGYRQEDNIITSPGYDTAENRADLLVSQAIGLLEIREQ